MDYTHTFTKYVYHILNNSPSKQCCLFSKAKRFPTLNNEDKPREWAAISTQERIRSSSYDRKLKSTSQQDKTPQKQRKRRLKQFVYPYRQQRVSPYKKEKMAELGIHNQKQKPSFSRRQKLKQFMIPIENEGQGTPPNGTEDNKKTYLDSYDQLRKTDWRSKSTKIPHSITFSPNKRDFARHKISQNQEIYDKPKKEVKLKQPHCENMVTGFRGKTAAGYYPLNIEMNPKGVSVASAYRKVPSHYFGAPRGDEDKKQREKKRGSPSAKAIIQKQKQYTRRIGPGSYNMISEFGDCYEKKH